MGSRFSFWRSGLVVAGLVALAANASAGWSYGVMTDTQGAGQYPWVSTRLMEPVVDRFVSHHNVDMMLSVGDLSDAGSPPEFDLWRQTAAPIYSAGIPMYATRGNHDIKTETEISAMDPIFGPVTLRDTDIWDSKMTELSAPSITQGPGASYMFSHNNAFFVTLDLYGATPTDLIGWLQDTALPTAATSGAKHKVLYQHEPIFGKARPGVLSSDPALELQLLSGMSAAGIDTIYTGHDHQYSRSVGIGPNGDVLLNHIVTGSNAEKYYRYEVAPGPNEGQAVQRNNRVGYSVVEVDGPLVTWTHYDSFAPDPSSTNPWTPIWEVADRMVYATNGDQFYVEANGSYAGLVSTSDHGTTASIANGSNLTFEALWTDPDPGETPEYVELGEVINFAWIDGSTEPGVIGDVLILDGLANDPVGVESDVYTLELSYDESDVLGDESALLLAYFDEGLGMWLEATEGNINLVDAAYGVDTLANKVWAKLDHDASGTRFAVLPEPSSLLLLVVSALSLTRRR